MIKIETVQSFFLDKKNQAAFFLILVGLIIFAIISPWVPMGIDWTQVFRPATLEMLKGHSPYAVYGYFYPPWALLPLIPFALLPEAVGRVFLIVVALAAFAYIGYRLGANKVAIIALLLSPLVLHEVLTGNIDWLTALGVVFPAWLGLFFLVIKPQIGIAVIIFWLYSSWKEGGIKNVVKTFAPVTIAYGLSLIVFGMWPLAANKTLNLWWNANLWPTPVSKGMQHVWELQPNASLWPLSIPVGLVFLVLAIRKNDIRYAMGASPCLSPYLLFHSWVIILLAISSSAPETIAAVVGLWILVAIRVAGG